jgi:hypothetical protein
MTRCLIGHTLMTHHVIVNHEQRPGYIQWDSFYTIEFFLNMVLLYNQL